MIQSNYFADNEDLQLQFHSIFEWDRVAEEAESGFRDAQTYAEKGDERFAMAPRDNAEALEYYRSILESVGELMGREVAPRAAEMDRTGLRYDNGRVIFPEAQQECYRLLRDAGLMPVALPREYGGLALPVSVQVMLLEVAARADAAFALAYGNINVAEIVARYGSREMCDEWLPKFASAEVACAMALTEPNYGSDLPNVQTRAVQDEDGTWRLTGTKRFITHACGYLDGGCGILTLARTGSPTSGARGLSFFLVDSRDIQVAGIETKMGLHCSPTCELVYENAKGILIGQEGLGLVRYSMGMMNSARITIAAQALGIAEAAHFEAAKYAGERVQFGKAIQDIPAVRRILDRMEVECAAMRGLVLEAGRVVDLYMWRKERLVKHEGRSDREVRSDEQVARWEKLADLLTPISKYYVSEQCVRIAYDSVQIHGGSGYTEEYDVARIYRDARITTIYEGTTQLQIVAAIGGVVAGLSASGFLRAFVDQELATFPASALLKGQFASLEEMVRLYRDLQTAELKARHAAEVVESAARLLMGLLFERSVHKLNGPARAKRQALCEQFVHETEATLAANTTRLRLANGIPSAATA